MAEAQNQDQQPDPLLESLRDACLAGDAELTEALLLDSPRSNDNAIDRIVHPESETHLIHYACLSGNPDVVSVLVEHGVDIHKVNVHHSTPLHLACTFGVPEMVETLLRLGGGTGINAVDLLGMTPLHLAAQRGNCQAVSSLLTFLRPALPKGKRLDLHAETPDGSTPLHLAVKSKSLELMRNLIRHGADVNRCDAFGSAPLHVALRSVIPQSWNIKEESLAYPLNLRLWDLGSETMRSEVIIRELLKHGARVNTADASGTRPLHLAAQSKAYVFLKGLIEYGADVALTDGSGDSALHHATYGKRVDGVKHLIRAGADPRLKNNEGWTPRAFARRKHDYKTLQALED